MDSFEELVSARKDWINNVLRPWCQRARRTDLLKAEPDWLDIAGKVAPEKTLWLWAWSRFPELVHESLGIEEACQVAVGLNDGRTFHGFPDARKSQRGQLVIWGRDEATKRSGDIGPLSIDDIAFVRRCSELG